MLFLDKIRRQFKHLELQTKSNNLALTCILFCIVRWAGLYQKLVDIVKL